MAYKYKEDERENKRIYYINHREVILERAKLWNKTHRERVNLNKKRYLDRLKINH